MSLKNVFASLIMLLCVTTVDCHLKITASRIEKAKKFEWIYYLVNGTEKGLRVLPPKFTNFDEAEKMCRDAGTHLASIHSREENDFIYGAFLFLLQQDLIEAALVHKTRHTLGHFILLGYTFPQQDHKWANNRSMDFQMFKGDFGTEKIYCGPARPKEGCGYLYMGNTTGITNVWCLDYCGYLAVKDNRVFGVCTTD